MDKASFVEEIKDLMLEALSDFRFTALITRLMGDPVIQEQLHEIWGLETTEMILIRSGRRQALEAQLAQKAKEEAAKQQKARRSKVAAQRDRKIKVLLTDKFCVDCHALSVRAKRILWKLGDRRVADLNLYDLQKHRNVGLTTSKEVLEWKKSHANGHPKHQEL
jgi:hypothetical protein